MDDRRAAVDRTTDVVVFDDVTLHVRYARIAAGRAENLIVKAPVVMVLEDSDLMSRFE
jgi:hypothetical protein